MRDHARIFMIYLLLAALLAIVPIGIARHMLEISRIDAFLRDQPNYLSHQYPPQGTAELTSRLSKLLDQRMQEVEAVPRIYLAKLPPNLPDINYVTEKKRLFISSLLPLVLRTNELIVADRGRLINLKKKLLRDQKVKKTEMKWLRKIAKLHRVRISGAVQIEHLDKLLFKIDIIPPSLALAQAAIESAWGTSKFAQQGNALFGEWVWGHDAKGIIPEQREEGKTHKVKSFDYLLECVSSYMTNLNRNTTYHSLRERRAAIRDNNEVITGVSLAPALTEYSARGNDYVHEIISIIEYNDLGVLDNASLNRT